MFSYWAQRAPGLCGASVVREVPGKERRKRSPRMRQLTIFDGRWGGPREGSGPKPKPGAGVPHDRRERFKKKPVHVTLRVVPDRNGLRNKLESDAVRSALEAGKEAQGFARVHYSIQHDHLHLIVEAGTSTPFRPE